MQDLTRIMKQAQPNCSENHAYSLAALFEYLNLKPDIRYFGYSEGAIARLVERNAGIAVVAQNDGLEQYYVRILHPKWLEGSRTLMLLTSAIRPLSKAAADFVEMVLDFYAKKEKEKTATRTV